MIEWCIDFGIFCKNLIDKNKTSDSDKKSAPARDRTTDLMIFSHTLSQLSYKGNRYLSIHISLYSHKVVDLKKFQRKLNTFSTRKTLTL